MNIHGYITSLYRLLVIVHSVSINLDIYFRVYTSLFSIQIHCSPVEYHLEDHPII